MKKASLLNKRNITSTNAQSSDGSDIPIDQLYYIQGQSHKIRTSVEDRLRRFE